MSRLRDPVDGCPWDRQQSFATIVPYTLEETYELADAIESEDFSRIREELGDVLFQVVFYAQLASEQSQFFFDDVVSGLVSKLVKRHPHVFPESTLSSRAGVSSQDSKAVKNSWQTIKSKERKAREQHSSMDDVPGNLPALGRAAKLQKRAARDGFDWKDSEGVLEKLHEEISELQTACKGNQPQAIEEELGDVLFSCVNLARHLDVNPEMALRGANNKFEQRYRYIETKLSARGISASDATLEQMDQLWDEAKDAGL
ncbi:nucleoside triphosphate pyrophosphohydrolase [Deltaproteobacteria bacterium]|nr:nucleoside triphosphate pyrophosphohydrolase [Deltaproteobacteria bacterium]